MPLLGAALRERRAEAARAAGEDELERGRALRTDGEECERLMHGLDMLAECLRSSSDAESCAESQLAKNLSNACGTQGAVTALGSSCPGKARAKMRASVYA